MSVKEIHIILQPRLMNKTNNNPVNFHNGSVNQHLIKSIEVQMILNRLPLMEILQTT